MTTRKLLLLIALLAILPAINNPAGSQPLPFEIAECQDFFGSIEQGKLNQIVSCLTHKPEYLQKRNDRGLTPLMLAAQSGQYEVLEYLLQSGANVDEASPRGVKALHLAAHQGSLLSVKALLANGAKVNETTNLGYAPIHYAAWSGNLELLKYMESRGANPDLLGGNQSSLILWAAMGGNIDMLTYLENKGFSLNAVDIDGDGALHWAASGSNPLMSDYLMKHCGFSINTTNKNNETPFEIAIRFNQLNQVKYFINNGFEKKTRNYAGETALHMATKYGSFAIARFFIEQGCELNVFDKSGATPLFYASASGNMELVKLLLAHGAAVNPKECNASHCQLSRGTPLHNAAWSNPAVYTYLVAKGAFLNETNGEGQSPAHLAASARHIECLKAVVAAGANLNMQDNEGLTPLHYAIKRNNVEAVSYLLNMGVRIDLVDNTGKTALHYLAIAGCKNLIQEMVAHGADLMAKDMQGNSALYYANYYGNTNVAKALLEAGAHEEVMVFDDLCHKVLKRGEASVWYLNHSGFAIKTARNVLIFDYWQPSPAPDKPCINNGYLCAENLKDEKVTVFVSHAHADHFDPQILEWSNQIADITYVFGFEPQTKVPVNYIEAHKTEKIKGLKITPIKSTDSGQGFLVEVDGVTIFHPGDHANGSISISKDFTDEIDFLAQLNKSIDISFCPVFGCRFPNKEALYQGNYYMAKALNPVVVFPMHGSANEMVYKKFADEANKKISGTQFLYLLNKGDRYFYTTSAMSFNAK